jgi:DNA-binding Xre family transcriptional regulator
MNQVGITTYRELGRQAQVSDWTIQQIRRDRLSHLRLTTLQAIATGLKVSLTELLTAFGVMTGTEATADDRLAVLEAEYSRLQGQMNIQEERLQTEFQQAAIATLEPWLLQWLTVAHAVAQKPDLPASRVMPLVQPVQTLLEQWGVTAIAPVGADVPYDPKLHELMSGEARVGDRVKVRYAGFWHQDTLLYRAKVSPL